MTAVLDFSNLFIIQRLLIYDSTRRSPPTASGSQLRLLQSLDRGGTAHTRTVHISPPYILAALLKNRLYRRWGIKTAREYARIKIDGLRLVGGNPDFTNAPGHGDDDARFYDRQQAYVHARGG